MKAQGFTLVELMVCVAIAGTLLALLMPAFGLALETVDRTACVSNLRQLGLATQQYLKDNDGWFFPLRTSEPGGTLWYFGFEPNNTAAEGSRTLDRTRSKLYPYLRNDLASVEICPAFCYDGPYKAKYDSKWWTYGINYELSGSQKGRNISQVRGRDVCRTPVFADVAQVNTWQAPASPSNPMVEEWFYIQPGNRMVQFRHGDLANVLMADWHIEALPPAKGSYHPLLPEARIGYFDSKDVLFRPQGR